MSLRPGCNYSAAVAHVLWEGEGGEREKDECREIRMQKEEERAARAEWQSETDRGSYNRKGEKIRCRRRDFI